MQSIKIVAVSIILILSQLISGANVIGYFTNWGIYGNQPYTPEMVPYQKLTHIQYAFFIPRKDGTIESTDSVADKRILFGKTIQTPLKRYDSTTSLIYLAHKNSVRVLVSIGGATGSDNFPVLASSATTRSTFCSRIRALIEQYNFDGVDIDWEFPCSGPSGTPADAQNFVVLLDELRDTMDAMQGDKKLITLAIAGGSYYGQHYLVENFYQYVDFISIMTYDYTGTWQKIAWHNSPLFDYGSVDNWSLNRAMEYYLKRGVSASKLNIGLAFYGHTLSGCKGPNQSFNNTVESASIDYSAIVEKIKNKTYTNYWDDSANVPFCLSSSDEYCTYDDTASIRLKSEYCVNKGYAGAIIWELKSGTLSDGNQPLLDIAANILKGPEATINMSQLNRHEPFTVNIAHCKSKMNVEFNLAMSSEILFTLTTLRVKCS